MAAPLGELSDPFIFEKVQGKYLSLARPVYGDEASRRILDIIRQLEKYKVTDLMALL
jgi:hypothetical protein